MDTLLKKNSECFRVLLEGTLRDVKVDWSSLLSIAGSNVEMMLIENRMSQN